MRSSARSPARVVAGQLRIEQLVQPVCVVARRKRYVEMAGEQARADRGSRRICRQICRSDIASKSRVRSRSRNLRPAPGLPQPPAAAQRGSGAPAARCAPPLRVPSAAAVMSCPSVLVMNCSSNSRPLGLPGADHRVEPGEVERPTPGDHHRPVGDRRLVHRIRSPIELLDRRGPIRTQTPSRSRR
jgi:hypothetical protein